MDGRRPRRSQRPGRRRVAVTVALLAAAALAVYLVTVSRMWGG